MATYKSLVNKHKKAIIKAMESLGTYRKEMDSAIKELAVNRALYDMNEEQWIAAGHRMTDTFTNKNGTVNVVKSQYLQNHQQLDDKILRREKELGLTAYSMDKMGILEEEEEDKLETMLEKFG